LPVALLPIEGRPPAFAANDPPAVGKPKCGLSIAAILDEGEPFGIGDQAVGETERMDQLAMARRFIVEGEAFPGVRPIS